MAAFIERLQVLRDVGVTLCMILSLLFLNNRCAKLFTVDEKRPLHTTRYVVGIPTSVEINGYSGIISRRHVEPEANTLRKQKDNGRCSCTCGYALIASQSASLLVLWPCVLVIVTTPATAQYELEKSVLRPTCRSSHSHRRSAARTIYYRRHDYRQRHQHMAKAPVACCRNCLRKQTPFRNRLADQPPNDQAPGADVLLRSILKPCIRPVAYRPARLFLYFSGAAIAPSFSPSRLDII